MDLQKMTIEELEQLKKKWYKDNQENISLICGITREIGEHVNANYGPKYQLSITDDDGKSIKSFVDDYGHYSTVHIDNKLVMSTHNERLYIPGKWVNKILDLLPKAQESEQKRKSEKLEKERQKLIYEMSLPE